MNSITQRLITMGTFPSSRALLLQIQLQTEGINCFLVSKDSLQPIHAVDLRVMEKDVAKAMTVIDQSLKEFGAGKEKAVKGIRVIRRILVPVDFSSFSFRVFNSIFALFITASYFFRSVMSRTNAHMLFGSPFSSFKRYVLNSIERISPPFL